MANISEVGCDKFKCNAKFDLWAPDQSQMKTAKAQIDINCEITH